ncbi:hypothetical protein, partial [Pseudomonas aeruginosa]|uniref:hypothetical protein n=1 Tax=Pseudomonas aeruginosa TaxID=287 RepID=UPI001ABC6182
MFGDDPANLGGCLGCADNHAVGAVRIEAFQNFDGEQVGVILIKNAGRVGLGENGLQHANVGSGVIYVVDGVHRLALQGVLTSRL